MADDVARVAQRCDDAKENQQLNLSCCRLKKMPDAIYFILRDIHVESCNLDDNLLRILPGKFCNNFKGLRGSVSKYLACNKLSVQTMKCKRMNRYADRQNFSNCV